MHITTNPLKMIMSAYHTIKKLGHNIVLKEIQHFVDYGKSKFFSKPYVCKILTAPLITFFVLYGSLFSNNSSMSSSDTSSNLSAISSAQRTAHRSRAWNSSDPEVGKQSTVSFRRLFLKFSCNQLKI